MGECILPVISGGGGLGDNPNLATNASWVHGYYREEYDHSSAYKDDRSAGWFCNDTPFILDPNYNYYVYTYYMDYYGYLQATYHSIRLENLDNNKLAFFENASTGALINPETYSTASIKAYISIGGLVDNDWKHIYTFLTKVPKTRSAIPIMTDLGYADAVDSYNIVTFN